MAPGELVFILAIALLVFSLPIATLFMSIIAFKRSNRITNLDKRIQQLEATVQSLRSITQAMPLTEVRQPVAALPQLTSDHLVDETTDTDRSMVPLTASAVSTGESAIGEPVVSSTVEPIGWETFIGQKAFGWLAVILFTFSAAFFLRYAFQNNWIGPVGRVAIGELVGIALVAAGAWYYRNGFIRFSNMMTSAGIVVLYLSTYSAFGLYRLMPQSHAGIFLAILVLESMIAAVLYRSASIALAAVIGGLLTPILISSDHDSYRSFFSYLIILNLGTVLATMVRRWGIVSSVCYVGTQGLFWLWYANQYHPEKFAWALGFQAILFGTYLYQSVFLNRDDSTLSKKPIHAKQSELRQWENLARLVVNALLGFASFQILLRYDYQEWLGTLAIAMASLYALVAHVSLSSKPRDNRLLLTSLALALGFVAWALPLQANTGWDAMSRWVGMGWAVIGFALWRFGLRISSPALRTFAGVLGLAAVLRLLINDLPIYVREPFIPIFNRFAFPALAIATCILLAVLSADSLGKKLKEKEQLCIRIAGLTGLTLVWIVLSFDCYGYFVSQSLLRGEISTWRWRGQLALTVLWTALATIMLVAGFRFDRARMRWFGMGLYGITVIKLFVVDMANVQQIYRILGFFVLAVVLGLVARAYQRFK